MSNTLVFTLSDKNNFSNISPDFFCLVIVH